MTMETTTAGAAWCAEVEAVAVCLDVAVAKARAVTAGPPADAGPVELLGLLKRLGVDEESPAPEVTAAERWRSRAESAIGDLARHLGRAVELARQSVGRRAAGCVDLIATAGLTCRIYDRGP